MEKMPPGDEVARIRDLAEKIRREIIAAECAKDEGRGTVEFEQRIEKYFLSLTKK
jgi:hypothetical protein